MQSPIRDWSDLEPAFRDRIKLVLQSASQTASDRWQSEFVTNPSSAAGLALTHAAMNAAGIWDSVGRVINPWAVGIFFVPSTDMNRVMERATNFETLKSDRFRHRLAHHSYWEKSWIQTNVRQAAIHIGINSELENGEHKAEVHLDIFNGFYRGFSGILSAKHVLFEVLMKRPHSYQTFEALLRREGVIIPSFVY